MGEIAILRGMGRGIGAALAGGTLGLAIGQGFDRRIGRGRTLLLHHRLGATGMGGFLAHHLAAQHPAGTRHGLGDGLGGEIIGDAALLFRCGGVDQPHQEEERHHRGDEVGIGHLPRAAMMARVTAFFDAFDDDRAVGHVFTHHLNYPAGRGGLFATRDLRLTCRHHACPLLTEYEAGKVRVRHGL
jgi:hypothetical protein